MDFGFFGIGTWELMVIGLIALIVLGPKQMILLARKAGELLREFQIMWQEASKTIDKELKTLEEDGTDLKGLGKEIQSLADEMKSTISSIKIPTTTIDSNTTPTIHPPSQPAPASVWTPRPRSIKPPNGNGADAKPAEQASESTTASAPAAPQDSSTGSPDQPAAAPRPDEPSPKYSAWSNKKPQG